MSIADKCFKNTINRILYEDGTTTLGQDVRAHWSDGTPAYTMKVFGVTNSYDLRKEFPAITVRKTALKSAMDEILWIFQRRSNNINDLNSHIWDEWADEKGSIGKAYGYQINKCFVLGNKFYNNQMEYIINTLKHDPFSRRIMFDMWNFKDLNEMHLQPCCYNGIFNVTDEKEDKLILNLTLNQRSNDMIAANNWNTAQYAILLMMVAQCVDMIPGRLMHCITDCHIYDRHTDIALELLQREEYPAPIVRLNPDVKNFEDFTTDDLIVENYQHGEQVKFEVAI